MPEDEPSSVSLVSTNRESTASVSSSVNPSMRDQSIPKRRIVGWGPDMLEGTRFFENSDQIPEMAIARFKIVSEKEPTTHEGSKPCSWLPPPSWYSSAADSTPRTKIITDPSNPESTFAPWNERESKNRGHQVRSVSLLETEEEGYEVPVIAFPEDAQSASTSPYKYEVDVVWERYENDMLKLEPRILTKRVDPLSAEKDLEALMKWLQSMRPVCEQQRTAEAALNWLRFDLEDCKDARDRAALAAIITAFEKFEWKSDVGRIPATVARGMRNRL